MDIDGFMESYKRAWETSDENLLASLFVPDGTYRNTPFAVQQGHEAIKQYWQRTKLQTDIHLTYEVLQRDTTGGYRPLAHHVPGDFGRHVQDVGGIDRHQHAGTQGRRSVAASGA